MISIGSTSAPPLWAVNSAKSVGFWTGVLVTALPAFAAGHPQHATVMHAVQQLGAGLAFATKPVGDLTQVKICIHLSGPYRAAFAHKSQCILGLQHAAF